MNPTISGPLTVVARVLISLIFLMSAVGNKIPNFDGVSQYMAGAGVPAPKVLLAGAIVFLVRGRLMEHAEATTFFGSPATNEADAFLRGDLVI